MADRVGCTPAVPDSARRSDISIDCPKGIGIEWRCSAYLCQCHKGFFVAVCSTAAATAYVIAAYFEVAGRNENSEQEVSVG